LNTESPLTDPAATAASIESDVQRLPSRTTPKLRALRRDYSQRLRLSTSTSVIATALVLWRGRRVHRFFGDELIANHRGARESLTRAQIEALGEGMRSWD
jgi:hypothetical protein